MNTQDSSPDKSLADADIGGSRASASDPIREALVDLITGLSAGDQITSERQLSVDLGVSRESLRRRIEDLESEGHLQRRHGAGTFVASRKLTDQLWLTSFTEDMKLRGLEPSSQLLSMTTTAAGAAAGARLSLSPDQQVCVIRRLRLADREPMALEEARVPAPLVLGLTADDLATGSFYAILESRYQVVPSFGTQTIEATVVDAEQAQLLNVAVHSPALYVERMTTDQHGRPIEYVKSVYRSDRYKFEVVCQRLPSPLERTR